jgi:hypothetical protein
MKTIQLKKILDSNTLLTQSGEEFYTQLIDALSKNERVIVDMSSTGILPSIILNISIGQIIDEYGVDILRKSVSFVSITRQQALRLSDYISKYCLEASVV